MSSITFNPVPKPGKKNRPKTKKQLREQEQWSVSDFKDFYESEESLQSICESWLIAHHVKFIHIPDVIYQLFGSGHNLTGWMSTVHRLIPPQFKKKVMDVCRGLPDLLIFDKSEQFNRCLAVELKIKKNKRHQAQINFAKWLNVEDVRCYDKFVELMEKFLSKGGDISD